MRELRPHAPVTSLEELVKAVPVQWRCAAKLQRARVRSSALVERHALNQVEGVRYVRAFDSLLASVEAALVSGAAPPIDHDEVRSLIRLLEVDCLAPGEGEGLVLLRWLAVQSGILPA